MGLSCSNLTDLEENECLQRFVSKQHISPNDPIWNKLFSHSLKPVFTKDDSFLLDSTLDNLRSKLLVNNGTTGNFTSLIKVFVSRASELKSSVQTGDTMFIWQAYNALFMVRNVAKYFVEMLDEEAFTKQFVVVEPSSENGGNESGEGAGGVLANSDGDILELLVDTLVKMIVELPLQSNTYVVHLEATNTLITLLSVQMFWAKPAYKLAPYRVLMHGAPSNYAPLLTQALLSNYVEQREPPYSIWHNDESGSIVIGVASGIWNMLRKGVGLGKTDDALEGLKQHNLANQSLYLLLVLVNHCTSGDGGNFSNPYREALITSGNEAVEEDSHCVEAPLFKISYCKLYETICERMSCDETTLLLYFLIHRNSAFKSYIMARTDIELLVLPILQTLYNEIQNGTSYHIYMSLIVMLILSEDQLFNQQVHDVMLKAVLWYTERKVSDITLGGLIILVIIRTIQYNILKMRDKYLHTNCLAALANMSSKFRSLHPYVSQRLISVFETLAKRHTKLIDGLEKRTEENGAVQSEQTSDMVQDINVLEEVIRMLLEILNSVFTHQLPQNRHLVYTLLYKKDIFDAFRAYDATQDLVYNLDIVIRYFTKRIGPESSELAVSEVMQRIEEGVRHWSPDILRKFPDLKFRYVEEDQPENFFIPYVWSLVYRNSGLYWSPLNLTLFSLDGDYA